MSITALVLVVLDVILAIREVDITKHIIGGSHVSFRALHIHFNDRHHHVLSRFHLLKDGPISDTLSGVDNDLTTLILRTLYAETRVGDALS